MTIPDPANVQTAQINGAAAAGAFGFMTFGVGNSFTGLGPSLVTSAPLAGAVYAFGWQHPHWNVDLSGGQRIVGRVGSRLLRLGIGVHRSPGDFTGRHRNRRSGCGGRLRRRRNGRCGPVGIGRRRSASSPAGCGGRKLVRRHNVGQRDQRNRKCRIADWRRLASGSGRGRFGRARYAAVHRQRCEAAVADRHRRRLGCPSQTGTVPIAIPVSNELPSGWSGYAGSSIVRDSNGDNAAEFAVGEYAPGKAGRVVVVLLSVTTRLLLASRVAGMGLACR